MEYSILTYKPKIEINANYFNIDKKPTFLNNVGRLTGDYYHDYFGLYEGDAESTLAHAAGAIEVLLRDPSDERAKQDLIRDTSNYFQCIYNEEQRALAYQLVETLAGFGFLKELAYIIKGYFDEFEERADDMEPMSLCQALDFRSLYIRIADKALFVNEDIELAATFYKFAGAYWDAEEESINPYYHFENDELSGLSEESIEKWNEKADMFEKIMQGYTRLDDSCLEYQIRIYDYPKMYDEIMENATSYSFECIEKINLLIERFGEKVEFADDLSRLVYFILASIKINRGLQILYIMSQDKDKTWISYQDEILSLAKHTDQKKYKELYYWLESSEDSTDHKVDLILNSVEAAYNVDTVLSLLKMDAESVTSSVYYTSFDTFSLMLPERCVDDRRDECGRISVMNVAYMNDPNEGSTVQKYLYDNKIPRRKSDRREIYSPYVFIKCFTSLIDYLPMWQMYGNSAKGVCVVINWPHNENISLFKVCYINKTNNGYYVRKDQNIGIDTEKLWSHLKKLKKIQRRYKKLDEKLVFDSLISPIVYLFKDSSYSYEQEYRMMFQYETSNKRIKHTKQTPPKLFVLSEHPIQIGELILGPCFENVADTMPYLREQLEIMAEKTGTVAPKVTISNIDFR